VLWVLVALPLALAPLPARGATPEQVEAAIVKAKNYLYAAQKNGTWDVVPRPAAKGAAAAQAGPIDDNAHVGGQWGGLTAVSTYALLAAGEKHNDPRLQPAIAFLKEAELTGTYAIAMRANVWPLLPETPETRKLAKRDADFLLRMVKTQGPAAGMYDYTATGAGGDYSHSRAQYAVLGVWAAARLGAEVPRAYWELVERGWLAHQDKSGGWTYKAPGETAFPITAGMTAAGVATLFITNDFLHAQAAAGCSGNAKTPALDAGVKWLADNFDKVGVNLKNERDFPMATLYTVERVGVTGGLKYFGANDWYKKGSDWIVRVQAPSGGFATDGHALFTGIPNTCFALLFLARGRAPVAMNKLEYTLEAPATGAGSRGPAAKPLPANWNQRPRDCANFTQWMSKQGERHLNWQVVNLLVPAEELHDSRILYVAGNQPLNFTDAEEAKLKQFVEEGGILFANADCASRPFADSVRKLGTRLFPAYEFRELPADHVLFKQWFDAARWRQKPSVLGLSNGVRELIILLPAADPARLWQTAAVGGNEEAFQFAANLFLYSVDKQSLLQKGETFIVKRDPAAKAPAASLRVARLQYPGNWDPEPAGWRRLANVLHNRGQLALATDPVKLGDGKLDATVYKLAHMTGTTKFPLTDAQQAELTQFVAAGGTLIVDAAGGSGEFATSAEGLLVAAFGSAPQVLSPDHPALGPASAQPLAIAYRAHARKVLGPSTAPRLRGIDVGGRTAVFYSAEDLSAGLVGMPIDGIVGYEPPTATDLMSRLLHRAAGAPAPAASPSTATPKPAPKPPVKSPVKSPVTPKPPAKGAGNGKGANQARAG